MRRMYEMATRIYDDGTPKTRHNTSNVQLEIDEADGRRAQQVLLLRHAGHARLAAAGDRHRPLQGHVSPAGRCVVVRQPDHVRRPARRCQPASEVLIAWAHLIWPRAGRRSAQGVADRLGARRVRASTGGAVGRLRGRRPQRHRGAHPAFGHRAQPADATACPRVDPPPPGDSQERVVAPIVVVGMMRSGTTLLQRLLAADPRFNVAYGWEVVEAAPRLDYRFTGVDPRIADQRSARSQIPRTGAGLFAIHPMYAREAEEEIVFLADAFLSHVPESGAHLPHYRSWLDEQDFSPAYSYLHRMLQFLQWQKRQVRRRAPHAEALGAQVAGPPRLSGRLRAQFGDLHIVHMHRDPRATIASGASLNATLHAMHADTVDVTGWARSGCSGWAGPTTARWRSGTAGPGSRRTGSPTSASTTRWPIRSGKWPGSTTPSACRLPSRPRAAMRRWLNERPREAARPPYGLDGLRPAPGAGRRAIHVVQQAI